MITNIGNLQFLDSAYFRDDRFVMVNDSQDIASCCESIDYSSAGVSGVLADVDDGDYREVWVTNARRPFDEALALYERIK